MLLYALAIPRISSGDLTETRATHPSSDPAPTQTAESDRTSARVSNCCGVGYSLESTAESDTAATSCGVGYNLLLSRIPLQLPVGLIKSTAE